MWWKALSVVLVVYSLLAGMLAPLKPGITRTNPETAKSGQTVTVQVFGYNSFYTRSAANELRLWLEYDSLHALVGRDLKILSDTSLEAVFTFPVYLPNATASVRLNAILDHPKDGVSLLPGALELVKSTDTMAVAGTSSWSSDPVANLHVIKDFTFPYRNVIYESIRNTYYHVPMWFALMFLFLASVISSARYLRNPTLENDRRASAYAETGLFFGLMGLVTGMLWAHYAWGRAWSNDIKQLMTAVALLIYFAYFILRRSFDEPEKGARLAAVYNIFAFASLIPLLYIVPRMFASLHPGATGNPAFGSQDLDNTMRLVFYPAIIGWTLLGFWMAQLRIRYQRLEDRAMDLE
jgi:heme exporter protein C